MVQWIWNTVAFSGDVPRLCRAGLAMLLAAVFTRLMTDGRNGLPLLVVEFGALIIGVTNLVLAAAFYLRNRRPYSSG